jgi:hypothetical protein
MGVWERSPAGIAISNRNQGLLADFRRALPDYRPKDNVGSPYCVRNYVADPHLGGPDGLASARRELTRRGMRLILDFVPNHVATDHPWALGHPEYFLAGTADELREHPAAFVEIGGRIFANGRDPYFPPWSDVLQLNAFDAGLRRAAIETASSIAGQCDGVRCDMAMLLLNAIFERTWGSRAGQPPAAEYWGNIIPGVRKSHPGFLFIAEAYWDLEWQLQQLGFDYCYDKRLYDRLVHDDAESVRLHLCADPAYQAKLVRFIENHDEVRAAEVFSREKERAAAITMATVPGARLFQEGQFEGRKVRPPVFLARRPEEPADHELVAFYQGLLSTIAGDLWHEGQWRLCQCSGWPDNQSARNILAWTWKRAVDRALIVVNLSDAPAEARVHLPWSDLRGTTWHLADALSGVAYDRAGSEMTDSGLYVGMQPWQYYLFRCSRAAMLRAPG